jgi:hypothetical protein
VQYDAFSSAYCVVRRELTEDVNERNFEKEKKIMLLLRIASPLNRALGANGFNSI